MKAASRQPAPRRRPVKRIPQRTAGTMEVDPDKAGARRKLSAEADQTLEAIRAGQIDALVVRQNDFEKVYALRAFAEDPETRVLFLTSHSDEDAVVSTILAGASGYLLKEIGSKALISAIEMVHGGQSILDPKVTKSVLHQMSILAGKADAPKESRSDRLSPQEKRILALVVQGKTNKEIAKSLGLSDKTVKNYLSNAFQKLHVGRRSQAAALFERDTSH